MRWLAKPEEEWTAGEESQASMASGSATGAGAAAGAYSLGLANERLRLLEELEREIGTALQCAGTVILELSKEKPNERLLDRQAVQFASSVQKVEAELSAQIRYLTQVATGQPHEGSSYSARKDCQMALNRIDYARLKLGELCRACEQGPEL